MSITRTFEQLGVPLANAHRSWGSFRAGVIVLRAWADEIRETAEGGRSHALVIDPSWHRARSNSVSERIWHMGMVGAGAPTFVMVCRDRHEGQGGERLFMPSRNPPIWRCGRVLVDRSGTWLELLECYGDLTTARGAIAASMQHAAA